MDPVASRTVLKLLTLELMQVSIAFCHIERILVVDQSRSAQLVPRCPVDEVGNSHSFHPQEWTEVSQLDVFCCLDFGHSYM